MCHFISAGKSDEHVAFCFCRVIQYLSLLFLTKFTGSVIE